MPVTFKYKARQKDEIEACCKIHDEKNESLLVGERLEFHCIEDDPVDEREECYGRKVDQISRRLK